MTTLQKMMVWTMCLSGLGVLWVAGCSDKPADPPPQPPPPDAGVVDAAPPPPPPPTAVNAPCDDVQLKALSEMLETRRKKDASRMQSASPPLCGNVSEGQTVTSQPFMLEPGYCYTVYGASLPPMTEIDMRVELDLSAGGALTANIKPLIATDTEAGQMGAISPEPNCYQPVGMIPLPAKVVMVGHAAPGTSGPMAAQVYRRKK